MYLISSVTVFTDAAESHFKIYSICSQMNKNAPCGFIMNVSHSGGQRLKHKDTADDLSVKHEPDITNK